MVCSHRFISTSKLCAAILRTVNLSFLTPPPPLFPQVGQSFIPSSVPAAFAPSPTPAVVSSGLNDLFELSTGMGMAPGGHVAPKAVSRAALSQQAGPGIRSLSCVCCLPRSQTQGLTPRSGGFPRQTRGVPQHSGRKRCAISVHRFRGETHDWQYQVFNVVLTLRKTVQSVSTEVSRV